MAEKKVVEFRHIRLEPADNGFVLEYTEIKETPGTMEDRDYCDRQMVFSDDEGGLDAAMDKMKELYNFNKIRKSGASEVTPPTLSGKIIPSRGETY